MHKAFFPLFALLETDMAIAGEKVVAQRKLLYLEKLMGSLLVATPRLSDQLDARIVEVQGQLELCGVDDGVRFINKSKLLKILVAMKVMLKFYLPAVFRIGYLVRCCTWEGRGRGTGEKAKHVLEEILLLLVHLLSDSNAKNEYVRTISVALLTWSPFLSSLPGVCFAEESCEALLSRMSHRCEVNRHLHGFDATFNLFLTLPNASRASKSTRGSLKQGLVGLFASRIRRIVFSDGNLLYCPSVGTKEMHSVFCGTFPDNFNFPSALPRATDGAVLERVLRSALRTLLGKVTLSPAMEKFFQNEVPRRQPHELREYQLEHDNQANWFHSRGRNPLPRVPKPPVKRTLRPKPRARRLYSVQITQVNC